MAKTELPDNPDGQGVERRRHLDLASQIMQSVEDAIVAANLPIQELTVAAAAEGIVSVFGITESEQAKRRVDEVARAVPGVVLVLNAIIVL